MRNVVTCNGCCNLNKIGHNRFECYVFRIRSLAPMRDGKCIAYNYHTEPCFICQKPIEVDNQLEWGWDETRTHKLCNDCLTVDNIPTGRRK